MSTEDGENLRATPIDATPGAAEKPKTWLTVREVAVIEKVTPNTVRTWILDGLLTATKTDAGKWVVELAQLFDYRRWRARTKLRGLEAPVILGLSGNSLWLKVAPEPRWAAKTLCEHCLADRVLPKKLLFRIESRKRLRGKLVCGRCHAVVLVGGPRKFHEKAWSAAPVRQFAKRGEKDVDVLQLPLLMEVANAQAAGDTTATTS